MSKETINSNNASPTIFFWVISIIAMLWYLMDVSGFFMRVFMSEETLLAMPENQQQFIQDIPLWVNIVFALEVFGGILGSIGLLLKNKWALPLFIISFIGVLSQTTYLYFLSDAISINGALAIVMPLVAILITIGLIFFTKSSIAKAWLK